MEEEGAAEAEDASDAVQQGSVGAPDPNAESPEITDQDLRGKTRTQIRDLAERLRLKPHGDPDDPRYPRKWRILKQQLRAYGLKMVILRARESHTIILEPRSITRTAMSPMALLLGIPSLSVRSTLTAIRIFPPLANRIRVVERPTFDLLDFRGELESVSAFIDGASSSVKLTVVDYRDPRELLPDAARQLATALLALTWRLRELELRRLTSGRGSPLPTADPGIARGTLEEKRPNLFDFSGDADSVVAFIDDGWSAVMVHVATTSGEPVDLIAPEAYRLATALLILAERLDENDNQEEYGRERQFSPYAPK